MTAINQDFTMWSGDTRSLVIGVDDGTGASVDVSSASRLIWILYDLDDGASRLRKDSDVSGVSFGGSEVTITIDPADTVDLNGMYGHEAELVDSAGNKSTVSVGVATVNVDYVA